MAYTFVSASAIPFYKSIYILVCGLNKFFYSCYPIIEMAV